jgi:hypothetical protein
VLWFRAPPTPTFYHINTQNGALARTVLAGRIKSVGPYIITYVDVSNVDNRTDNSSLCWSDFGALLKRRTGFMHYA